VFDCVAKPVVERVLEGYNGTIFAYGQTGTGKTFTMVGEKESPGIIPRALEYIFSKITMPHPKDQYEISLSFIQIYMEAMQDLLEPGNTNIKIREDPACGVFVTGVSWIPVGSVEQCMNIFEIGEKNRAVAFTALNAHSSRSHAVLMIKVEHKILPTCSKGSNAEEISEENNDISVTNSILYLVDLAGSERVKKTRATANRLDEAKKINFSLSALGNCIHALTDPKTKHIPYRDSKLTRLLQDSLGGNAKTSMVVTIGPAMKHVDETLSSLKFGRRAMHVQNKPRINQKIDYKGLCMELQGKLYEKSELLNAADTKIFEMKQELSKLKENQKSEESILKERNINQENKTIEINGKIDKKLLKMQEIEDIKKNHLEIMRKKDLEQKELLSEVDKTMAEQEKIMQKIKNELEDTKKCYSTASQEKQQLELKIKNLENELKENCELVQKYKIQLNEVMGNLQEKEIESDNFIHKHEQLKGENILLNESLLNTQKILENEKIEQANKILKIQVEYDELISKKTKENQELLENCKNNLCEIQSLREELNLLKTQKITSDTKIEEFTKILNSKNQEILEFQEKIVKYEKNLQENSQKITELESQIAENTQIIKNAKNLNQILQEENSELNSKIVTSEQNITKNIEENKLLRENYSKLLSEQKNLKESYERLHNAYTENKTKISLNNTEISRYSQELKQKEAEIIELKEKNVCENSKIKEYYEKSMNELKQFYLSKNEDLLRKINFEKEIYEQIVSEIYIKYKEIEEIFTDLNLRCENLYELNKTRENNMERRFTKIKEKFDTICELHNNDTCVLEKQHKIIKQYSENEENMASELGKFCTNFIVEKVINNDLEQKLKIRTDYIEYLERTSAHNLIEKINLLDFSNWSQFIQAGLNKNGKKEISHIFNELLLKSCTSKIFQTTLPACDSQSNDSKLKSEIKNTINDMILIVELENEFCNEFISKKQGFYKKNECPFGKSKEKNSKDLTGRLTIGSFIEKNQRPSVDIEKLIKRVSLIEKNDKNNSLIGEISEFIQISDQFLNNSEFTNEEQIFTQKIIKPLYNWIIAVSIGAIRSHSKNQLILKQLTQQNRLIGTFISIIAQKEQQIQNLKTKIHKLKTCVNNVKYEKKAHDAALRIQKMWRKCLFYKNRKITENALSVYFSHTIEIESKAR